VREQHVRNILEQVIARAVLAAASISDCDNDANSGFNRLRVSTMR
jgi:hypothetical protein